MESFNKTIIIIIAVALCVFTLTLTISTIPAYSTTIVGIRTPELVVIAGDSMGSFRGRMPEYTRSVCKIFIVHGAGFAISGMTKDPARGFDSEAIVAEALWGRDSIQAAMNKIRELLSKALIVELERLKIEDPALYKKSLRGMGGYIISVLIAAFGGNQPVARAIGFKGQENSLGRIALKTNQLNCPGGDCPGGVLTFFLGERNAIDRYTANYGKNFGMSPEEAAPFLVGIEISAGTTGVGPQKFRRCRNQDLAAS